MRLLREGSEATKVEMTAIITIKKDDEDLAKEIKIFFPSSFYIQVTFV
jgi:hypothetical protein